MPLELLEKHRQPVQRRHCRDCSLRHGGKFRLPVRPEAEALCLPEFFPGKKQICFLVLFNCTENNILRKKIIGIRVCF